MALQSQRVAVPIAGGMNEEAHDYVLEPPEHAAVINLEHTSDGALVRRDELKSIASITGRIEAMAGTTHGTQERLTILANGGAHVMVGDVDAGNGLMTATATKGPRSVDIRRHPIVRSSEGATAAYSACAAGYACHVWTRARDDDDGAIWIRIDDMETGAPIFGPSIVPGMDAKGVTTGPHIAPVQAMLSGLYVVASGEVDNGTTRDAKFIVFGREAQATPSVSDVIASRVLTISNGAVTPGLTTSLASTAWSSVFHADPSESKVFVCGFGVSSYVLYEYDASGFSLSLSGSAAVTGSVADDRALAICHGVSSQRLMAVFFDAVPGELRYSNISTASTLSGTAGFATLYNPSGSAPGAGGNVVDAAGVVEAPTGFVVAYQSSTGLLTARHDGVKALYTSTIGTLSSSAGLEAWGTYLLAQPFVDDDGKIIVPLCADATRSYVVTGPELTKRVSRRQAYLAELDGTALRRICEYGQDVVHEIVYEGAVVKSQVKRVSSTYRIRSGEGWGWPVLLKEVDVVGIVSGGGSPDGASAGFITCTPGAQAVRTVSVGDSVLAASGYLAKVDGERVGEVMQLPPPSIVTITTPGADSSSVRLCWTWRDAYGVLHRTAPSEQINFGWSSIPELTVAMPPFGDWTSQGGALPTDVWLEVYMSPFAPGAAPGEGVSDGSHYRRRVSLDSGLADSKFAVRLSDIYQPATPWVSSTVYVEFLEPGELPLYTDAGVLDHDPVPCPADVASTRDRLWVLDAEDRGRVFYTAPMTSRLSAPAFSQLLTTRVPPGSGEIVALGTIDDLVVFFCDGSIHAVEAIGGPDSTGVGAFPPMRNLSTERGCVNPRSVITTDAGLLFQARDGIWSIDGSGAMTPIGRPVRNTLRGRTVRDALVVSEKQQAIFLLETDAALVLDMEAGAWAEHLYSYETTGLAAGTIYDGRLVFGTQGGVVWRADPALPIKGAADIDIALETGWIKLAGLQGFKRCRRLGLLGRLWTGDTVTPDTETHTSLFGDLVLTVWYDYSKADPSYYQLKLTESSDIGVESGVFGGELAPFHWRVPLARQKCAAIKIGVNYLAPKIVGEPPGGVTIEAYPLRVELVGLALEVGAKRGIRKIGHGAGGTVT